MSPLQFIHERYEELGVSLKRLRSPETTRDFDVQKAIICTLVKGRFTLTMLEASRLTYIPVRYIRAVLEQKEQDDNIARAKRHIGEG